jgi:hypothetical protein
VRASSFGNVVLTILGLELKSIGEIRGFEVRDEGKQDSHRCTEKGNERNVSRIVRGFLGLRRAAQIFVVEIAKVWMGSVDGDGSDELALRKHARLKSKKIGD